MAVIAVQLGGRSYDVIVGERVLEQAGELAAPLLRKTAVPIVADANARAAHGARLEASLQGAGYSSHWFDVPAGEGSKSWPQLQRLTEWLLNEGVERGDSVLALGGGVVGDLTGFACSMVKRGCGFVQIPTTLLAQVDSSVGGKTAINTAAGKNLIGAFHQPSLVLADIDTLGTLPMRERRAGFGEVIKYGILGDATFFHWCAQHGAGVVAGDPALTKEAVTRSIMAKARIVAEDERETTGARALLNLGHTFAHALEAATGYGAVLLHGEAVALGMVLAARYSQRGDLMPAGDVEIIVQAMDAAGLPTEIAPIEMNADGATLVDHMRHDKKMDGGTLPFILLRGIGEAFVDREVRLDDVALFLDEQMQSH
ncbi:MAG: 3-dehydroquinate synthase [Pontixanthobacter sp.]